MSTLLRLECPECGHSFDADQLQTYCEKCVSPLLAIYDLTGGMDRQVPNTRPTGIWRWSELLPLRDMKFRISLGEGDTPLLPVPEIAKKLGLQSVYVKDEGVNPTGTFKARGIAVAVSRAWELGVKDFVIPTAGNAGGALASYAARGGLEAHVYMPIRAPELNKREVIAAGADLQLVDGYIDAAGSEAHDRGQKEGWFNIATFKEPYRVEGKKTMGFELAEAFGWELPDVIVYPTGGGTGLVGMWKAFKEMVELGWIEEPLPRMVSVQSLGCAPVVRAFERGDDRIESWSNPSTYASGLEVPTVFADRLILSVIRESDGSALAVDDEDIRKAQCEFASVEGIFTCPEGAATLAGAKAIVRESLISKEERVVLFNTGTGLKYLQ